MRKRYLLGSMLVLWVFLLFSILCYGTGGEWIVEDAEKIEKMKIAQYTRQLIIVAVDGEEAILGFYQKEKSGEWSLEWETQAQIGKNGLGKRREGDGKTPIGAYRLIEGFGILENPGTKIHYVQVDENDYWVDDATSKYYNQFVDIKEVQKDWSHAEHISEYGEVYHYVLATDYNEGKIPGAGSAVFLHCATAEMEETAGCVAIPEIFMKQLLKKIEAECVLVIDEAKNILQY